MNSAIQEKLSDLRLTVGPQTLEKIMGADNIDFSPARFDFNQLGVAYGKFREHIDQKGLYSKRGEFSQEEFVTYLKENLTSADQIRDFALNFAERAYVSGKVKLKGIHDDTAALIREVAPQVEKIRNQASDLNDRQALKLLRDLDRKLLDYVGVSKGPGAGTDSGSARVSKSNYWALNDQHKQIAVLIKEVEAGIKEEVSPALHKRLMQNGLLGAQDVAQLPDAEKEALKALASLKIVHVSDIKGSGKVYSYPQGDISAEKFEALIPKGIREKLGEAIRDEFRQKYSGKARGIGVNEGSSEAVPTLLDRSRVKGIAAKLEIEPSLVVHTLKYLAEVNLLQQIDGAYHITPAGEALGLGFKAIRLAKRIESGKSDSPITIAFQGYLERALEIQKSWIVPSYDINTKEGGLPRTFVMDRWLMPNGRFSQAVYEYVKNAIPETSDPLVIMGNMTQGLPAIDKRQMRTTVMGFEDLNKQMSLMKALGQQLNAPVLNILGPNMDRSAEMRAFEQVLREKAILGLEAKADERAVRSVRESKNDQYQYTIQRELAKEIKEWGEFISRVVFPLEIKLGRQLWESHEVSERTDIDMNELEIVRDMSAIILRCGSVEEAMPEIDEFYSDFLKAVEAEEPNYAEKLGRVLLSKEEKLSPDEIVSRAGAQIQLKRESDQADGLKINVIPDINYGKAIRSNPTTSMVGFLKSAANRGDKDLADVNFVLNSAEPWISITGTGKWVISTGTMEYISSEPRDLFYEISQDHIKKKRTMFGKPPETGVLVVSGGVDEGIVTHALKFEFITPKLLQVLEDNKARGLPQRTVKVYSTSDWQIGSPTMKEKMALVGLLNAIKEGADEVLMNGDIQQGMNYMRYCVESGLVQNPLIGVEDQTQYIIEMMNLVTEYIGKKYKQDPDFKIPKFRINVGNHEVNTQANKGLQGNWLLSFLDEKLTSYFHALLDDRQKAEELVRYPRKYVSHDGTPVDYSLALIDYSAETGFRIESTHYDGAGAKGSSFAPPIKSAAAAVHSLELQEPHIIMRAHYHTPAWTTVNGMVCGIFGANAGQSGFERHLGYTDAQPANGMIELHSDKVPTFMQITEKYLDLKEEALVAELHSLGIMTEFNNFEDFCNDRRKKVSLRMRGATDYSNLPKGLPHDSENPNRSLRAG